VTGRERGVPACIGIGSKLDDPVAQVRHALENLHGLQDTRLLASSGLYRNPPMGPIDQPDYINAVAMLLTRLGPRDLLLNLKDIERGQGRPQSSGDRWGPRCLDLDILTYGYRELDESDLTIPHPGISERNFVLFPMLEIVPQLHIPGRGLLKSLVAESDGSSLERIQ
jgi:2-amino-4-hydroxy-6-hydroxymethyldihydropteridine diphosphokinase